MRYIAAEDVAKAKEMEKYITDERTGLKYELVGDYWTFFPYNAAAPPVTAAT